MKHKSVAVLGLGLFGRSVARNLARQGIHVVAIDMNMEYVEEVMDVVDHAVQADFTKMDQLKQTGVASCDIGIVATGEKLEVSILGIMHLRSLGIQEVIVKTKKEEYQEVLMKVGATRVVLPEIEMGARLAGELALNDVLDVFQLDETYRIVELHAKKAWFGNTIRDMDFRTEYGFNIIALKTHLSTHYTIHIDPDYVISKGDVLVVLAEGEDIEAL